MSEVTRQSQSLTCDIPTSIAKGQVYTNQLTNALILFQRFTRFFQEFPRLSRVVGSGSRASAFTFWLLLLLQALQEAASSADQVGCSAQKPVDSKCRDGFHPTGYRGRWVSGQATGKIW